MEEDRLTTGHLKHTLRRIAEAAIVEGVPLALTKEFRDAVELHLHPFLRSECPVHGAVHVGVGEPCPVRGCTHATQARDTGIARAR